MAKRKTASKAASKTKTAKTARSKKAAPARKAGKPATRKTPRKAKKAPARPARKAPRKAVKEARKPVKAAPKKATPGKARPKAARKPAAAPVRKSSPRVAAKAPAGPRRAPALERERRTVADEDVAPTPPSSLDLDRTASAARSGRHEAEAHRREVTQTSPDITAGDVDADWESAYSVGDETPGGDNPTPNQDVVDEIGQALGIVYADDEELGGEGKLSDRDTDRWELDPESSEDFKDRDE